MNRLDGLEVFVGVVDNEGFTAAARELDVSKSFVSKQISRLEDRLGVRLLNRTTRQVTPTAAGEAFYDRCAQILEDLEAAERAVTQLQTSPRGTLRVSLPMSFGLNYVAPVIGGFLEQFPELEIDLDFSDRQVDIVDEGYDMVIRIGNLKDSSLIARKLAPTERFVCASSSYLKEHGVPKHPQDLKNHECLLYSYKSHGPSWRFEGPDGEILVRVDGRIRSNNGNALVHAAVAGLGLTLSPDFISADAIRSGELEPVLTDWTDSGMAVWALYPHRRYLSAKVRLFVDYLREQFSDHPPWKIEL
ncbi:MAG: LysR family transcriptional regulator [Myxococcota bacterium]